jgi:hypothetical protein
MGNTIVSIEKDMFATNNVPMNRGRTWEGASIEGLLFNSRMVQGIFDDRNPETAHLWVYSDTGVWDPDRNTREFVEAMPSWREKGLLAFTICLQGGCPRGYCLTQPWHNSAINADGSLDPTYMARLERIVTRADELGMIVILSYFYFGQEKRLPDEAAIVRATDSATDWVLDRRYTNVVIEVSNECNIIYTHSILTPHRVHELIARVQDRSAARGARLPVSVSYGGGTLPGDEVMRMSDFLLVHGNHVDPAGIEEMIHTIRRQPAYRGQPIVFNEDDHFDFENDDNNLIRATRCHASWGYLDLGYNNYHDGFQCPPVNWRINTRRKKDFFALLEQMTRGYRRWE